MAENKRKVFICNKGGHNYEGAEKYGELVYITEGSINRFATSSLYRSFVECLEDSSKDDYFLITSVNTLNAIGAAVFARKHGRLNLLLYKGGDQDEKYILREIDIDSLLDIEEIKNSF